MTLLQGRILPTFTAYNTYLLNRLVSHNFGIVYAH